MGIGQDNDIIKLSTALSIADEKELDLVQVGEASGVAICKLMDYSKYIYNKHKAEKNSSKAKHDLKEIRISPSIADNDIHVKARAVDRMLSDEDKVKLTVIFKGREMAHMSIGIEKLKQLEKAVTHEHSIVQSQKTEGNRVYMLLAPACK